jgi:hypothetical protein
MTLGQGLFTYLSTKAAIVAVVGTRVFPIEVARQLFAGRTTNLPCITFQLISTRQIGAMLGSSGMAYKRYQITAWSDTYNTTESIAELVRLAMDGYTGSFGTVTIQSCLHEGEGDTFELPADDETARIFGRQQDYMISYTESVPTL